ncbi:MAG: hypothetical protein ACE5KG_01480 [Nitrososphaerales archaeon]
MKESKWAARFIKASIIQGLLVVVLTAVMVLDLLTPSVSRVIAGGGAGTWFFVGYSMYILVGVLGVALTALFYFYIETILGKAYTGLAKALAAAHLILMNVGVVAAAGMLMAAGYIGGSAGLAARVGGLGLEPREIHGTIAMFPEPIAIAILVLALGIFLGGLGYIIQWRK